MTVADILGIAGFVLASGGLLWQGWRYYAPLRLVIDGMDVQWVEENQAVAMFRLVIVNPSTRGRTMCALENSVPEGIIVSKAQHRVTEDRGAVIYLSPKGEKAGHSVPIPRSEALEPPLDIPPGQSQAKYCVLVFHLFGEWADKSRNGKEFRFGFRAIDASRKLIASRNVRILLLMLKTRGVYSFPHS